jgi:RNA polymerase sigma-70 factor (ECF subfamily)
LNKNAAVRRYLKYRQNLLEISQHHRTTDTIQKMTYANKNDNTLIRLVANSDSEALGELYDRYKTLVFSLAVNIVGSHETAEDITLDVFTKIWEKADTYRPEKASVRRWICSITRYRSIDMLRHRNARPDAGNSRWSNITPDTLPAGDNAEEMMELALIRRQVTEAVSNLPEEQKKPLALAYFKGYTHSQIAEMLNLPLGTIKTRIRLAIHKLQQELNGFEGIDDRSKSKSDTYSAYESQGINSNDGS